MKISKFIILFLILFSFDSLNANEDKLKTEITKNLRCLVCQGQSVYDSDSEFAVSLKLVVENKIQYFDLNKIKEKHPEVEEEHINNLTEDSAHLFEADRELARRILDGGALFLGKERL